MPRNLLPALTVAAIILLPTACTSAAKPHAALDLTPTPTPAAELQLPPPALPPGFITPLVPSLPYLVLTPYVPPAPALPTVPTVVSPADLGILTTPIRWVPVDSFTTGDNIPEPADPFARDLLERQAMGNLMPSPPARWSVQVVEPGAAPREIYSTARWLTDLSWMPDLAIEPGRPLGKDAFVVRFTTRRLYSIPGVGDPVPLPAEGTTALDPAGGKVRDEWDMLPGDNNPQLPAGVPAPSARTVIVSRGGYGGVALISVGQGYGPFRVLDAVYFVRAPGETYRLEGLTDLAGVSWLPGGAAIRAARASNGVPTNDAYILPMKDGDALFIGSVPFGTESDGSVGSGRLGSRAVMLLPDQRPGAVPTASRIVLYDTIAGRLSLIGDGPAFSRTNSLGFPSQIPIIWPAGQSSVFVGAPVNQVIDITTGATRPGSFSDVIGAYTPPVDTSPSGRYVASFEEPELTKLTPDCQGLPRRLDLKDTQWNQIRTLLECPGGTSGSVLWLTNSKLIARIARCWACDGGAYIPTLLDIDQGTSVPLTDDFKTADVYPSLDKTQIAVAGANLRIYSSDGALLRDLGPLPDGYVIGDVAWRPNGSFAFLLKPAYFFLQPY